MRVCDDGGWIFEAVCSVATSQSLFYWREADGQNDRKDTASTKTGTKCRLMDNLGLFDLSVFVGNTWGISGFEVKSSQIFICFLRGSAGHVSANSTTKMKR